jgi:(1->4)-alpha-D-glucan 1-alpha-D-glucosylmutase
VGLAARGGWDGTGLPLAAGTWRDVVADRRIDSDGSVDVQAVLATYPVALLVREDA